LISVSGERPLDCRSGLASIDTPSGGGPDRHGIPVRTDHRLGPPPRHSASDRGCDAAQMSVSWFCLVISASESRCPRALGRNLIEAQAALGVAGVAACKGLPAADRDVDKPRLDFQRTGMLDTFCGSGTTILAAERVGRDGSASARSARRPSSRRPRRQIAPRAAAGRLMRSQGSGHGRKPANQEQNATGRPRQPTMLP
jgi:hypothetical protein